MEIRAHKQIKPDICGIPLEIAEGYSLVQLTTTADMAVDSFQLVHGGFIFGLADYAAMIAVNHPHVVLAAADVNFLKPVVVNDTLFAEALIRKVEGKKNLVDVVVSRDTQTVFEGLFTCFILSKHVLDP